MQVSLRKRIANLKLKKSTSVFPNSGGACPIKTPKSVRTLKTLKTLKTLSTLKTLKTLNTLKTLKTLNTLNTLKTLPTHRFLCFKGNGELKERLSKGSVNSAAATAGELKERLAA